MLIKLDNVFDMLCERICDCCENSNGDCMPLDYKECPFWSSFEDLEKLCKPVDEVVDSLMHSAQDNCRDDDKDDYSEMYYC